MLDQDFCAFLEYEITKAFSYSENKILKRFWCDGVLLPDNQNEYSKKYVNDKRKIIMKAFIGESGQDKYKLTLHFGKNALSKYAKDLDIKECLSKNKIVDWLHVDILNKQMEIQLS